VYVCICVCVRVETNNCVVTCLNIIQHYLFVYHSYSFLYFLIPTVNVTGCKVLTLCDGQLAVLASNCTLCGYVLEYYSALFVRLSHISLLYCPIFTFNVTGCRVPTLCDGQLAVSASNSTLCGYVLEYY
jgi:hypothetical protein